MSVRNDPSDAFVSLISKTGRGFRSALKRSWVLTSFVYTRSPQRRMHVFFIFIYTYSLTNAHAEHYVPCGIIFVQLGVFLAKHDVDKGDVYDDPCVG